MAEHTPPSIDKVRSQATAIENHGEHKPENLKSMGEKEYFRAAYPEGYGLDKKVKQTKIEASGANLTLFEHRKAGFCTMLPEVVKASGLSDESKNTLLRYAHSTWEIRADQENGEDKFFFVLRDDADAPVAIAGSEAPAAQQA